MSEDKIISDEALAQAMKHMDAACTIMGMCMLTLHDPEDDEYIRGFILAPLEYFKGDLELEEAEGVWEPPTVPDAKSLN